MSKKKHRKGLRLGDRVVEKLPFKRHQYTVWDLTTEGCGVRVSRASKACVISVRVGEKKKFETIGTVGPDRPYEYLREQAIKRIGELKRARLPRTDVSGEQTLREAMEDYFTEHPELSERTVADYRKCIGRGFELQMDQPASRLTASEILRLNRERLEEMTKSDPTHKPPRGFYIWQGTLRALRAVLSWHAAQKERPSPWPDRRALKIRTPRPRELPVELQSVDGRRRLIEGLKAINSNTARACRFIAYTGFRRREGTALTAVHMLTADVLEFKSKTRTLRVPLSKHALALVHKSEEGRLLRVSEWQLRKPLIRIFGERMTTRGKKACVTPHDLRRYFKTIGTELGIDPTVLNLLVGHTIKGVDQHYIAKLRLSVLRAAAQRIADEIDNPRETVDEETAAVAEANATNTGDVQALNAGDYLSSSSRSGETTLADRHIHYFKRDALYELVWTAPVVEVASRLGVSDVALAKLCRRAAIPIPGRGYWTRVEWGEQVDREPLPKTPDALPELLRIRGKTPPPTSASQAF